ncbi:MAG: hypothetical protein AB2777_07540 [Candidatus Thiodiazotropha endolucinida]
MVDTNEVEPTLLKLDGVNDQITGVTIDARENQLIMKFQTVNVFAEDNENAMNDMAFRCFTALAHKYGFSISNMRRGGSKLPQKSGKLSTVINTLDLRWNIEAPLRHISGDVTTLLHNSTRTNEYDIQLIHQFVVARSEIDNVSRFMFLYNLALQIHSDNQRTLDESILRIEPKCTLSRSPISDRNETIYTRLRNQVAHFRDNTNIEATRKEIDGVVGAFKQVVFGMLPRI